MTHRSASRCYLLAPGKRGLPPTFLWHLFSRPTPLPSAGNWVRFSCSIPPLFVLSHSMPVINTTGKLASFWRFSLTTGSLPSDSLATILPPLAPLRPTTLPRRLLPATDGPSAKKPNGPDLDERVVYLSMSPNQAIFTDKIIVGVASWCATMSQFWPFPRTGPVAWES